MQVIHIEGIPFRVRLPSRAQIERFSETAPPWMRLEKKIWNREDTLAVSQGFSAEHQGCEDDEREVDGQHLGFCPVFEPLNPNTLEPDTSLLDGLPDYAVIRVGGLFVGNNIVNPSSPEFDNYGNWQDWEKKSRLPAIRFIERGFRKPECVVKAAYIDGFLLSVRPVLTNISRAALKSQQYD